MIETTLRSQEHVATQDGKTGVDDASGRTTTPLEDSCEVSISSSYGIPEFFLRNTRPRHGHLYLLNPPARQASDPPIMISMKPTVRSIERAHV